jgi:hypothetical protein
LKEGLAQLFIKVDFGALDGRLRFDLGFVNYKLKIPIYITTAESKTKSDEISAYVRISN